MPKKKVTIEVEFDVEYLYTRAFPGSRDNPPEPAEVDIQRVSFAKGDGRAEVNLPDDIIEELEEVILEQIEEDGE